MAPGFSLVATLRTVRGADTRGRPSGIVCGTALLPSRFGPGSSGLSPECFLLGVLLLGVPWLGAPWAMSPRMAVVLFGARVSSSWRWFPVQTSQPGSVVWSGTGGGSSSAALGFGSSGAPDVGGYSRAVLCLRRRRFGIFGLSSYTLFGVSTSSFRVTPTLDRVAGGPSSSDGELVPFFAFGRELFSGSTGLRRGFFLPRVRQR